ncbi:aminoglycoside phosphotransferase family protein [Thiomicrospira microaerophila]|uniref:aminoglycoside phosphotransferase family protein n=1 Tax=Thiomicrospira microaerophila TaxID=406020 RepID=UPI000698F6B3|nr:phosphotransferase [Thiomicrospira microaerophila]
MDLRFSKMQTWLAGLAQYQEGEFSSPVPASSDASFRRYFRTHYKDRFSDKSLIIMDAPPEKEDCRPFVEVSNHLDLLGFHVPKVLEQDLSQGFLLLTDLGEHTYLSVLSAKNVESLYSDALGALARLHQHGDPSTRPIYTAQLLGQEMALFSDWLGQTHCEMSMNRLENQAWLQTQQCLIKSALAQPQVYVHRDYHSRNLMVTRDNNPGILDFQDALKGPLTYDAVSLLRDCYIRWPADQVGEWQREYFLTLCQKNLISQSEWSGFVQAMDWMGIQRHLKAAGIFARLYHRDGKDSYLKDIPTTLGYITEVGARYAEMRSLVDWTEKLAFQFAQVKI